MRRSQTFLNLLTQLPTLFKREPTVTPSCNLANSIPRSGPKCDLIGVYF